MVSSSNSWQVRIPPELQAWVTNRLVSAHIRAVRSLLAFLILNFLAIFVCAYGTVQPMLLGLFGGAMLLALAHRAHLAIGIERRRQRSSPDKLAHAFALNSGCLGVLTGGLLALTLPHATAMNQIMLAVSGAVQIAGIAFTTRTLPRAAFAHMIQVAIGLTIGFLQLGGTAAIGVSVLIFAAVLLQTGMIMVAHKSIVDRVLNEREANENAATVRMLLNDFESQGSDWLFELDDEGRMLKVNERFSAAARVPAEDMNGRHFAGLFVAGASRTQLEDEIAARNPVRDLLLERPRSAEADGQWWSVSMRPNSASGVARFRGVISDVSAEKHAEARVLKMAMYDGLTELPNRLMFIDSLKRVLKTSDKRSSHAILIIDFDHFKSVNDMYGHPMGDKFLRLAGNTLTDAVAKSHLGGEGCLVARLGGDEFAVLIGGEDAADKATRLSQYLVEQFENGLTIDGIELPSSTSIGVALAPIHADTSTDLMSYADMALYVAKNEGRSRWEMFEPGMDKALQDRHALSRDLRSAVSNGELRLFLQPLVNVESGLHTGFEALMRWEHPDRGMVMPNDFIPLAEETGLIVPIGEWMLRTAMAEAASWSEPHAIAINLSPLQLRSPTLLPTVVNALAETGIDPGRVELEITETVLLHDCETNIQILNKLHALGLKIALDDFGTGYASLNYLLTFPFDKIKIDRSFVTDIESRSEAQAIVSAVISLANQLGMCTLAEGVEHEEQLAQLRKEGCEMVQGWLFGKAMPVDYYSGQLKPPLDDVRAA